MRVFKEDDELSAAIVKKQSIVQGREHAGQSVPPRRDNLSFQGARFKRREGIGVQFDDERSLSPGAKAHPAYLHLRTCPGLRFYDRPRAPRGVEGKARQEPRTAALEKRCSRERGESQRSVPAKDSLNSTNDGRSQKTRILGWDGGVPSGPLDAGHTSRACVTNGDLAPASFLFGARAGVRAPEESLGLRPERR
ncbi:hypothetical protein MTO96_001478 [Rhipicephalus appendiculatus]